MRVTRLAWAAAACSIIAAPQALSATYEFTTMAFQGQAATGTPGTLGGFGDPTLNEAGDVVFLASLLGLPPSSNSGIYKSVGGQPQLVAREGQAIPGADDTFQSGVDLPTIAGNGDVAFLGASLNGQRELYRENSGVLSSFAQIGDAAPGTSGTFSAFSKIEINDDGDTAFVGSFRDQSLPISQGAVWTDRNGALEIIAQRDDTAPDTPNLRYISLSNISQNADGDLAFKAILTGSSDAATALFAEDQNGDLRLVAREGQAAVGTAGVFDNFGAQSGGAILNDGGDTAFRGTLKTDAGAGIDGTNNVGIFRENGGLMELVAVKGGLAGDTGGTFADFANPDFNAGGDLAFAATLNQDAGAGITAANDTAIFTFIDGLLEVLIREGDLFDIGGGDIRTVRTLSFFNNFAALNNAGDIAFKAFFTDGSQGVFRASLAEEIVTAVPVPPALAFLVTALLGIGVISRPRSKESS